MRRLLRPAAAVAGDAAAAGGAGSGAAFGAGAGLWFWLLWCCHSGCSKRSCGNSSNDNNDNHRKTGSNEENHDHSHLQKKRAIIISSADGWKQDVGNGKDDLEQHEAKLGSGASGILLPKERWR